MGNVATVEIVKARDESSGELCHFSLMEWSVLHSLSQGAAHA